MKDLLKKKSTKIALLLIVVAVIAIIVGINVQSSQKQKEYDRHMDAAEKYMTELDYEQAIVEYTFALDIYPNDEKALEGLEKAYLAYADELVITENYEEAIQVLGQGYEQTGIESLQEKQAEVQEQQIQAEEKAREEERLAEEKAKEEERLEAEKAEKMKPYMQQVYDLMAAEDYSSLESLFLEIAKLEGIESLLEDGGFIYFPQGSETQTGIGVGIYPLEDWHISYQYEDAFGNYIPVSHQFAFYYGEYVDGKRQGKGVSICYAEKVIMMEWWYECQWVFSGEWKNDAPNGYGKVWNIPSDRYSSEKQVFSGNLVNGLWDGEVAWEYTDYDGAYGGGGTFQAANGKMEDKTEDYCAERERIFGTQTDRAQFDDCFVYTYNFYSPDINHGARAENSGMIAAGSTSWTTCVFCIKNGATLGVWEFADVME